MDNVLNTGLNGLVDVLDNTSKTVVNELRDGKDIVETVVGTPLAIADVAADEALERIEALREQLLTAIKDFKTGLVGG